MGSIAKQCLCPATIIYENIRYYIVYLLKKKKIINSYIKTNRPSKVVPL